MNLTELDCDVDDFWQDFAPQWQAEQLSSGERQRQRAGQLHESEIIHPETQINFLFARDRIVGRSKRFK